jgi:hypothetical protein
MNTKYFQLLVSGKYRKTRIFQLQDENKIIEGDDALKKYITSYYKGLFGSPQENNFWLHEFLRVDIPPVIDIVSGPDSLGTVGRRLRPKKI